ncbi:MAG: hypothetical protein DYH05_11005 [Acidobacteria bacterium ACB1]|nr:hypothetical protein [Pyrinomonadaceae bacterium]MCE7963010.1 hypothetical protein [Acidobacteria bacterium ACB1]RIJ96255.1 MAG: hypothetical protein DCC44_00630 [Acidobacteriota bacterium]
MGRYHERSGYRIVTAVFGLGLLILGGYVCVFGELDAVLRYLVGSVILLLGGDLVLSALRRKESLLSKLGPLP